MAKELVPRRGHGRLAGEVAHRACHHGVDAVLADMVVLVPVAVARTFPVDRLRVVGPDDATRVDPPPRRSVGAAAARRHAGRPPRLSAPVGRHIKTLHIHRTGSQHRDLPGVRPGFRSLQRTLRGRPMQGSRHGLAPAASRRPRVDSSVCDDCRRGSAREPERKAFVHEDVTGDHAGLPRVAVGDGVACRGLEAVESIGRGLVREVCRRNA